MTSIPWVEKYRPNYIKDICIDPNILKDLLYIVDKHFTNNIIIIGSPGVGKTTTLKCFANELYGPYIDKYVLEINASDDRGIKIHTDIINFCKVKIFYKKDDEHKYANHKLIILDEADNITNKAQRLISNMMEQFKHTTKFIFTCNYSNKIIQSIQSKSKIIMYPKLNDKLIIDRLKYICNKEHTSIDNDACKLITHIANGDMRTAINICNIVHNRHTEITEKYILDIYNIPHQTILKDILKSCIQKDIVNALNYTDELNKEGFCGKDILVYMFTYFKNNEIEGITEAIKYNMLDILSKTIYEVSNGVDSKLQLYNCIFKLNTL